MGLITTVAGWAFGLILIQYLGYHFLLSLLFKTKDLKRAYNAKWALVTGASSGIGKSIAKKLASQGLNVVLVALQDPLLDESTEEIKALYPELSFRKMGVNLGRAGYLAEIAKATDDIDVQVVFCNAGYMVTGFFSSVPLEAQMMNLECNSVSAVQITHHLLAKLTAKKLKGCFVYTSSAAACIVSPFTVLYSATKAFLSAFGAGLAAEVKHQGIDVLVFHPSPVATHFYDKAHKLDALDFFKKFVVQPDDLPDIIFASIGRTVWRDIGATAITLRIMMKIVDYNLLATFLASIAHRMPDFKRQKKAA